MDKVITVIWFLSVYAWAQSPDKSTTSRPVCFSGWTGPNSGGSCSFNTSSLCDWKNVDGNDLVWELIDDEEVVHVSPDWWSDPELGRLRSPPFCEQPGQRVCVEVKFRFGSGGGSRLYAEACGQQSVCMQLFNRTYRDNTNWRVEAVEFDTSGSFEIFIVGEKYENTFGGESDIYIDYIAYNTTSCHEKATRVTSPPTPAVTGSTISTSEGVSGVTGTFTSSVTSASLLTSSSVAPDSEDAGGVTSGVTSASEVTEGDGELAGTNNQREPKQGDNTVDDEEDKTVTIIIVSVSAVLLLVLGIALFVAVLLVRRRSAPRKTPTQGSAQFERNESLVLVTNQLYACMGQPHPLASTSITQEASGEQERQPAPTTPVTSAARTSRSSDVYYTSMSRPVSSPPRVTSDDDDDGYEKQMIFAAAATAPKIPGTDENEDKVYENEDPAKPADDDKAIYENEERTSEEKGVYENTEASRDTEPAAKKDGAADETYEKVEPSEYSHLMDLNKRPDRRATNYDRIGV